MKLKIFLGLLDWSSISCVRIGFYGCYYSFTSIHPDLLNREIASWSLQINERLSIVLKPIGKDIV